jgi:hypothetical protein
LKKFLELGKVRFPRQLFNISFRYGAPIDVADFINEVKLRREWHASILKNVVFAICHGCDQALLQGSSFSSTLLRIVELLVINNPCLNYVSKFESKIGTLK